MSLRKDRFSWIFVGVLLIAVAAAAYFVLWPQMQSQATMQLGDGVFKAQTINAGNGTVVTPSVAELQENKAVIRIYTQDRQWALDVRERTGTFDLVWLDKDKKVVHIVKNASAKSQPSTVFRPNQPARYIVELQGGIVDRKAININSKAVFDEATLKGLEQ